MSRVIPSDARGSETDAGNKRHARKAPLKKLLLRARRWNPGTLLTTLFAINGLFLGSSFGGWPWWLSLGASVLNLSLLIALRVSLSDYLLAKFLGVDAIIPQGREPQSIVVAPNPPPTSESDGVLSN